MNENFKIGFFKTLWIIKDYLSAVVIGGGWVPVIFYHYLLSDKSIQPIMTRDIDLMVDNKLPISGNKSVDTLLSEAGLTYRIGGQQHSPAVKYEGQIDGHEVEIEFLVHHSGRGDTKVVEVQSGLRAQALRYVAIAVENTIEVEIDDFEVEDEIWPLKVKVPSPAAFIFQKGLVFTRRRDRPKKEKDLYYIFEVLANCTELKGQIIKEFADLKNKYRWFNNFKKNIETHFSDGKSIGVTMVSNQRPPGAFPDMTDAQFEQYVIGIFQEFTDEIRLIGH